MFQPLNALRTTFPHYFFVRITLLILMFAALPPAGLAATKFDFGGPPGVSGPVADYVIYHPALTSHWYGLPSTVPPPPPLSPFFYHVLGDMGSRIAPADYDGDGLTDYGVFDSVPPSRWTIDYTAGGSILTAFGIPGDIPQPANFVGNSQAEIALFRPSTGQWLIQTLPGSTASPMPAFLPPLLLGNAGDIPAAEDYDGDGFADVAIWRPSTGDWWIHFSSLGPQPVFHWGTPGDIPVPADYDGDGNADMAVFRPSNCYWYIWRSGTNPHPLVFHFGLATDMPIPADYNGDGKADAAMYRPSDGTWWVNLTGWPVLSGLSVIGDTPAAHAYIN
jgi:hypothetical protein